MAYALPADIATHAAVTASVHGSDGSGKFPSTPALAGADAAGAATSAVAAHAGNNTHAQIDTALTRLANTSGSNTGDQTLAGLGGVPHSLATALNDFLVASGAGTFVKKTLAEVLTILGKAAASGLASLDANSKLVQLRARADDGLGYAVLANDTLAQNYAVNSVTKLTVTANRTLTTTVPPAGCTATMLILTSGTTSYTITFGTGFKAVGTLATGSTSGRVFAVSWVSDGTSLYETGRTAAMVA